MSVRRIPYACALVALLAGCQSMPIATPMPESMRAPTFRDCTDEAECNVTLNPHLFQWLPQKTFSRPGQHIHFRIRYSDIKFAEPPIVFKTEAGTSAFSCRKVNDQHVRCENGGAKGGEYEYGVRVLDRSNNVVIYDPWIVNR